MKKIETVSDFIGFVLIFIGLLAVAFCLSAAITMWLWNWVMHGTFGLKEISFYQAFGLTLILGFFGGFFHKTKHV